MIKPGESGIFSIRTAADFNIMALEIFRYQAVHNPVYHDFLVNLRVEPSGITDFREIPFLPVSFFRTHKIISGNHEPEVVFESSGTTGTASSRHYVSDTRLYKTSFLTGFRQFYGDPGDYMIAGLLPSYTERENSSLVYMVNELIRLSDYSGSGFYKDNFTELLEKTGKAVADKKKVLLLGVSFALLDLAENLSPDLSGVIVMETGGMKGRRKELTREELHQQLTEKLNVKQIHSEYGMTELLSQAYSKGGGIFNSPGWMKILIRDPLDPLSLLTETGRTGGINVIDLANISSCSFIATDDLGRIGDDDSFEVLGRIDNSDVRGCNLLVS